MLTFSPNPCPRKQLSTEEIRTASVNDPELQHIRECITNNTLHTLPNAYKALASELYVANSIVLRGNRIVLLKELRTRAITVAHEDHAEMTRCKHRLRSKLWRPGLGKDVKAFVKRCYACQVTVS